MCTTPFPSMPLGFWNDPGDERYARTYFERFPGAWHQGDFASWTEHGGIVISGRSDATLNPGGVRIGTAEISAQVDKVDGVVESLVIGQEWDGDTRVVCFVVLAEGIALTDAARAGDPTSGSARARRRATSRRRSSPCPTCRGRAATSSASSRCATSCTGARSSNTEALANPEALDAFRDLEELQS